MLGGEGVGRCLEDDRNELGYNPISQKVRNRIVNYHHRASPPFKSKTLPNESIIAEGGNALATSHYTEQYTKSKQNRRNNPSPLR